MSATRIVDGPGLPAGLPFSLAAGTDDFCFISGMPALDALGRYQPGTFEEEADLAWRNVMRIADTAGFAQHEIVYVQCVIADIGDYSSLNDWWRRQFTDIPSAPARFTFQAAALPFGCKVEMQAVAARRPRTDRVPS
ncbi:RidA family protein [Microbacterium sp. AZCO]|uniref:RidA family protein n=1 Tax=Microbacterium sp. AZCO TaxID=3142976 RepID=UPI0031F3DD52